MADHLASIFGTEKDRVNCPFYFKIGCVCLSQRVYILHVLWLSTYSQTLLTVDVNPHGSSCSCAVFRSNVVPCLR